MRVKLVDFKSEVKEVEYGTCELCMSTGTEAFEEMLFEYDDGHSEWVELWDWDWGDIFTINIENVPRFAQWLKGQELDSYISDYSTLEQLVYEYEDQEVG